jgi:hypothetical protein
MKLTTYEEWIQISESKSQEQYVNATLTSPSLGMKKGDVVKVDALQYTSSGNNEKVDIIMANGRKSSIEKKLLDVKI